MDAIIKNRYTKGEEIANALTHGIGATLGVAGFVLLLVFTIPTRDVWQIVSCTIFGASIVLLYTMSTLYHAFVNERLKKVFRILDHSAIYIMIAATYTPYLLIKMRTDFGMGMLAFIWICAIVGVALTCCIVKKSKVLSAVIYLAMGWVVVFLFGPMREVIPSGGIILLISGGISYSLGTVFYLLKRLKYHHAVFHLFIVGGTICHFLSIFLFVVG